MKNLARCLVILFMVSISSSLYAQEWVAYNPYFQTQPQIQMVYVQPQPVVIYQWVPYSIQQNIVIEKRCLFHTNQIVSTRPITQWVLQPVIIYR